MQIGSVSIPQARDIQGLYDAARIAKPGETATGIEQAGKMNVTVGPEKGGFSNFLESAIAEVDGKMQAADAEKMKVFTGETDNLHQAMISMQEASVAFSLMVEVRNKLVESYQELMRMQV
jgi:flagellar hook-basal body complex protein FliE